MSVICLAAECHVNSGIKVDPSWQSLECTKQTAVQYGLSSLSLLLELCARHSHGCYFCTQANLPPRTLSQRTASRCPPSSYRNLLHDGGRGRYHCLIKTERLRWEIKCLLCLCQWSAQLCVCRVRICACAHRELCPKHTILLAADYGGHKSFRGLVSATTIGANYPKVTHPESSPPKSCSLGSGLSRFIEYAWHVP